MTIIVPARRRARDLQALLDGDRASSPAAARELAPLVALANALAPADLSPAADFRAALHDRLVAEAAVRVPVPAVPVPRPRPTPSTRFRRAVAAVVVTAAVVGGGAAVASTRALPGDPLYGLKRQIESVQLALAHGDAARGRELMEQADARLSEAETMAAAEHATDPATRTRIGTELTQIGTATTAGSDDLLRAYRDTGDAATLRTLERFTGEQSERLTDLALLLDPELAARARALAAQLAALHDQTSTLTGSGDPGAAAGSLALAAVDGWARSWARDRSGLLASAGGAGPGAGTTSGSSAQDPVGAVGGVVGSLTGGGTSGSGGTTVGGVVGSVLGGSTSSSPSLPTVSLTPLPTLSPAPLPTSSPLLTDPVGTVTSAVPLPTSSPLPTLGCVPVPPLTTC